MDGAAGAVAKDWCTASARPTAPLTTSLATGPVSTETDTGAEPPPACPWPAPPRLTETRPVSPWGSPPTLTEGAGGVSRYDGSGSDWAGPDWAGPGWVWPDWVRPSTAEGSTSGALGPPPPAPCGAPPP